MSAQGRPLDRAPDALGPLRPSDGALSVEDLRSRLYDDGYLFLPRFLDRDEVLVARRDILERLATLGELLPGTNVDDAIPRTEARPLLIPEVCRASAPLTQLLYGRRMMALFDELFDEPATHFTYTWLRAFPPGLGSRPHIDSVFMNRGSTRLLSAWTPLGDIDVTLGGVAVLEGSHRLETLLNSYASLDVDSYCEDDSGAADAASKDGPLWDGSFTNDPVAYRAEVGCRWLTADFVAGDLLIFPIFTAHVGLDNNSNLYRLSCDSRYQPASDRCDPRWIGDSPAAHGPNAKTSRIC